MRIKKTCNNATSNGYGPRQCFPLVVILKSLLPVIVRADIPQLEDDQAEVLCQSQSSLFGVAASRSHHPELLAVAILKEKAVYHHLRQRWEDCNILWCTYVVAKLFSFRAACYMFSLVQVVLTTSPQSGQPLKYHIVNANQSQNETGHHLHAF